MTQRRNRRGAVEDRWTKTDGTPSASAGVRLRWRARYVDDTGKEHVKGFEDKKKRAATQWLAAQMAQLETGSWVDPKAGRVTFADYFARWSERQVWVPGTARAMALAAGSVTFATMPIADVKRSDVEGWVKSMTVTRDGRPPLAASTITTRFNNVRSVFNAATRDRLISWNPADDIRLPRRRKAAAALTIPTPDEVGAILAATDPQWRAFVALCAFGGLRLGEAAAVQVADISFLRRELAVTRQVQRANGNAVEIRAPKFGSERTVFLPAELVDLLAAHVRDYSPGSAAERWLFWVGGPNPPHQNTVGYWWRRARAAAGLPDVRLHDLRHFYASGLIAAGCDVVTVQRAMGHASATVTLSTYAHLWPDAEDRTRAAAAGLMAAATGSLSPSADALRT